MNRPFIKMSVVTIISLVLLYYSVAWAVLRCFHDEHQINSEVVLSDVDRHDKDFFLSSPSHAHAYLDCMGPGYHIESLAESSSLSQLQQLTANIISRVNEFLPRKNVAGEYARDLWLRAVFDRVSPLFFLSDSPRYLLLSILRI
jgi:hypothetical protein